MASVCAPVIPHSIDESKWTTASRLLLVNFYRENKRAFMKSRKYYDKRLWQSVSQAMANFGHHHTSEACFKMYKAIEDRYFYIMDGFAPRDSKEKWPLFKLMADIMADRPTVRPLTLSAGLSRINMLPLPPEKQQKTAHVDVTSSTLAILREPRSLLASTQKVVVIHPPPHPQPSERLPTQEINPSLAHTDKTSNTRAISGKRKALPASTPNQRKITIVHQMIHPSPPEPVPTKKINVSLSSPTHQLNMTDSLSDNENKTTFLPFTHQLSIPDSLSIDEINPSLSTPTHEPELSDPLSIGEIKPSLSPPPHQPEVTEPLPSLSPPPHQPEVTEPLPPEKATLDSTSCSEESVKLEKNDTFLEEEYYDTAPPWLQAFLGKQSEKMDQQIELQKQLLQEARENNKILKRIVEVLENGSSKK